MTTSETVLAVVSATMVLAINWRALQSHDLPAGKLWKLAAIWVVIIAAVALIARIFTG